MIAPDEATAAVAEAAEMAATNDELDASKSDFDAWEPDADEEEEGDGPLIIALGDAIDSVTLLCDRQTGEILSEVGAPNLEQADAMEIAEWVGQRRANALGRLEGLRTRRQAHLDRVAAQFDKSIVEEERYIRYLETAFQPALITVWKRLTKDGTLGKTCKEFLMTLKMRRKPGRTEVVDKATALQWAKLSCPDAVKVTVTHSVLVSKIPATMKLPESASGMRRVEPTDVFEVE